MLIGKEFLTEAVATANAT